VEDHAKMNTIDSAVGEQSSFKMCSVRGLKQTLNYSQNSRPMRVGEDGQEAI
jgi:hypothetical protein